MANATTESSKHFALCHPRIDAGIDCIRWGLSTAPPLSRESREQGGSAVKTVRNRSRSLVHLAQRLRMPSSKRVGHGSSHDCSRCIEAPEQ